MERLPLFSFWKFLLDKKPRKSGEKEVFLLGIAGKAQSNTNYPLKNTAGSFWTKPGNLWGVGGLSLSGWIL